MIFFAEYNFLSTFAPEMMTKRKQTSWRCLAAKPNQKRVAI